MALTFGAKLGPSEVRPPLDAGQFRDRVRMSIENKRMSVQIASLAIVVGIVLGNSQVLVPQPAQDRGIESGRFLLHNVLQRTGEEWYQIRRHGESLVLTSEFRNADRGTAIPLAATLQTRSDLTPERFEVRGKTSGSTAVDSSIVITSTAATVREGSRSEQIPIPAAFFTVRGYAPVAIQMMLLRYWSSHGKPRSLRTLPDGEVTIENRGRDQIEVNGRQYVLDRYSVKGVIWGRETLWLDASQKLVALITIDAGLNQFEAVGESYDSALHTFVAKAASDSMEELQHVVDRLGPIQKNTLAIVGGKLIDGTGSAPLDDSVVVIQNGRISAVGPRSKVRIPPGANIIDAHGSSVLPGLWDMHAHFNQVEWGPVYLAAGVTTVRDCGNEFEFEVAVRDAINSGHGLGPRMLLAGFVESDSPDAIGAMRANSPEQVRTLVARYHAASFVQMKIYNSVRPDLVPVITAEAHRLGMTVTGHIPKGMTGFEAVQNGLDQINHVSFIYPMMLPPGADLAKAPAVDPESQAAHGAIQFLKEHGTVVDPTLAFFEMSLHSADVPISTFEPGIEKVAPELLAPLNDTGVPASEGPTARTRFEQYVAVVRELHRAGIPIVAGSDQNVPGHSLHRELELYVASGFTPMEAIQAATIVPARIMKLDQEVGTVERGKRADLIIVDGDPLASIGEIRKTRIVVTAGRKYDCGQLWQSAGFRP
jgi:imidazolonepropionase-like amidohydrolase